MDLNPPPSQNPQPLFMVRLLKQLGWMTLMVPGVILWVFGICFLVTLLGAQWAMDGLIIPIPTLYGILFSLGLLMVILKLFRPRGGRVRSALLNLSVVGSVIALLLILLLLQR